VNGGVDKEGIVTTDMTSNFSLISTTQVSPNGVVQRFDQFVNPSIKDLHSVMSLLTGNTALKKAGILFPLDTSDVNGTVPEIVYVQGKVVITQNLYNKVLIIGEYNEPSTSNYHIGLALESNVTFEGLIILLPDHDVGSVIKISLADGAQINGAIVASSLFDPNNPQSGPGINLSLNNTAKISYDYNKIVLTGYERQFAVLQRVYISQ
jgi:hypothetical protein